MEENLDAKCWLPGIEEVAICLESCKSIGTAAAWATCGGGKQFPSSGRFETAEDPSPVTQPN